MQHPLCICIAPSALCSIHVQYSVPHHAKVCHALPHSSSSQSWLPSRCDFCPAHPPIWLLFLQCWRCKWWHILSGLPVTLQLFLQPWVPFGFGATFFILSLAQCIWMGSFIKLCNIPESSLSQPGFCGTFVIPPEVARGSMSSFCQTATKLETIVNGYLSICRISFAWDS